MSFWKKLEEKFSGKELEELHRDILEAMQTTFLNERQASSNGCPCIYTTPCMENCTCVYPMMSTGCLRCARYGSIEQKTATAKRIASKLGSAL